MTEYIRKLLENYWSHTLNKIYRAEKKAPEFGAAIDFDMFIYPHFSHQSQQELTSKSSIFSQQKRGKFLMDDM